MVRSEIIRNFCQTGTPDQIIKALEILSTEGTLTDLQLIMGLVKHDNYEVKRAASDAICEIIKENLIVNFSKLDKIVREKLTFIMESLDPKIIEEISKDLYGDDEERRLRAVQVLGLLRKNPKLREILSTLIKDRDVKVKATAVNLLGKIIGPNDHEILLSLLNDSDRRVRANTVEALEKLGNKRLVPILLRYRHDANNRIRGNVLKALWNLGFQEIEEDLIEMLSSSNDFMKASALWVIAQIKYSTRLIEDGMGMCLLSDNLMVHTNARKALQTISTPRAGGYLKYLDSIEPVEKSSDGWH